MQTEVPWLHVPWTRIYYYGETGQVSANGMAWHLSLKVTRSWGTTITMPLDWAWAMEMENGEDVRGSLPRKQELRGALLYTGGGFRG